jgi:hypothetical protein
MAKRFTDTNKWSKEFFQDLPIKMKLVWMYLCDSCDNAGIWDVNLSLVSYQLGVKVTVSDINKYLGSKIIWCGEDKLFIPSFFTFQYGDAKDSFSAKIAAIKRLRTFGLVDENGQIYTQSPHYTPTVGVVSKESTSISIGISKGISILEGGVGETNALDAELSKIYQLYPKKVGKTEGFVRLKKQFSSVEELQPFRQAVERYADHCRTKALDGKYIKHFSSFITGWQDWLDADAGKTPDPHQPTTEDEEIIADFVIKIFEAVHATPTFEAIGLVPLIAARCKGDLDRARSLLREIGQVAVASHLNPKKEYAGQTVAGLIPALIKKRFDLEATSV